MIKSFPLKNRNLGTEHRWYSHTEQMKEGVLKNVLQLAGQVNLSKGKGKAIPLQAWTGPEASRRLRLPDFKTTGTWW
jgi:hypothetical protein